MGAAQFATSNPVSLLQARAGLDVRIAHWTSSRTEDKDASAVAAQADLGRAAVPQVLDMPAELVEKVRLEEFGSDLRREQVKQLGRAHGHRRPAPDEPRRPRGCSRGRRRRIAAYSALGGATPFTAWHGVALCP
jgi:hypothetical protein